MLTCYELMVKLFMTDKEIFSHPYPDWSLRADRSGTPANHCYNYEMNGCYRSRPSRKVLCRTADEIRS